MKTKEDIIDAISNVKHPAIDYSLLKLGIVKGVDLIDNIAKITFAFPFPNIPIANTLINLISNQIEAIGVGFQYEIVLMTEEERINFMEMESNAWMG